VNEIITKLHTIFANDLDIEVPDAETDLLTTGLLDSMTLVDLLMRLETVFDMKIPVADLEIDNFRTIASIAAFVANPPQVQHAGA
jgi:acyl carrier protein